MSINETIIIVVCIICATYLITLYNRRGLSTSRRLTRIISKLRKENGELREGLSECYREWFEEFTRRQKTLDEILDKIYELNNKNAK